VNRAVKKVLLHGLLALVAVATLTPLLWMVSVSLMPTGEANSLPPRLLPSRATFEHYATLFSQIDLGRNALNSAFIATATTAVSLLFNALAGYSFAKLRFRGRDRLFALLLAGLVVPAQVAMLPLFLMLKSMGLVNTYLGVMIPGLASISGIFLIRQYALSIPDELLDAARVDGASERWIFRAVVLPLLLPILVTLAVFTFLGVWNDFLWPLIVLTDDRNYTLPVALANLSGEHYQDTELMMAGSLVTLQPTLVLFFLLQRYYLEGILLGSVKE